jgi:hypothetical protein
LPIIGRFEANTQTFRFQYRLCGWKLRGSTSRMPSK